jgi:response regulator RpfG family c-di-GMP phosphodiesterase
MAKGSMSGQTILILDPNEQDALAFSTLVRREGYRALTASCVEEALAQLRRERVALAVAADPLPGEQLSGVQFLRLARQHWPDTVRVLLVDRVEAVTAVAAINEAHVFHCFSRPLEAEAIRAVVRDSVRFHDMLVENRRLHELTVTQALQLRALNEQLAQKLVESTQELESKTAALREQQQNIVRLVTGLLELRSSALAKRAAYMADAARWLAQALGLSSQEREDIELAAALHNLGQVGLPDEVLRKDAFLLSKDDKHLLRQSALVAESLLALVPGLRNAARIVRHQGEWWNGQGFPDKLAGEAIPVGSRILAVIAGYQKYQDWDIIYKSEGKRYDPLILKEFRRYVETRQLAALTGPERRVNVQDLSEGMTLTRDVYSNDGILLAARGKTLDRPTLAKLHNFIQLDPNDSNVFVSA